MKVFLIGFWLLVVALGSTFGAGTYLASKSQTEAKTPTEPLQSQKTRVLNIPMIADGVLQGFVSVQFIFTMDGAAAKTMTIPPETYLLDEAFRTLYTDPSLDFRHLEKYDLSKVTKHLVDSTNARLGVPLIKDVLIADMNYSSVKEFNSN